MKITEVKIVVSYRDDQSIDRYAFAAVCPAREDLKPKSLSAFIDSALANVRKELPEVLR